ncbi:tyrosine-type recombinase/integrase [Phytoactinopolyspora mesophila]|nr:tyrosine-type recombinase/integrase [Phytoactinopolyspora mesophila]
MPTPPTNAGRKFVPEPLSRSETDVLIKTASNRSSSGIRLRAIIGVLYGAGVRLQECLDLYSKDVETQAGTVRVRDGKGGKYGTVGITPRGADLLDRWLDRRKTLGLNGRHPIFAQYTIGKVGEPLDPRYVRSALARLGAKAGIEKRVHPHGLRHSLAFQMAQDGDSTHEIRDQLRHTSLAITDRYVRQLHPSEVIETMRQKDW